VRPVSSRQIRTPAAAIGSAISPELNSSGNSVLGADVDRAERRDVRHRVELHLREEEGLAEAVEEEADRQDQQRERDQRVAGDPRRRRPARRQAAQDRGAIAGGIEKKTA